MTDADADHIMGSVHTMRSISLMGECYALFMAAYDSGLIELCTTPTTVKSLARDLGRDETTVRNVCEILRNLGFFVTRPGDSYVLAPGAAPAFDPAGEDVLDVFFQQSVARVQVLKQILDFTPMTYEDLPTNVQYRFANGAFFPAESPLSVDYVARMAPLIPELHEIRSSGGRQLELGCGVGNSLLIALQNYPTMTAVGIDTSDILIREARRCAIRLGVSDRIEFVIADAKDFQYDRLFDAVSWSQSYFVPDDRAPALATVYSHLRDGGLIVTYTLSDEDPYDQLTRTIHESLVGPQLSQSEMFDELRDAGFTDACVWGAKRGIVAFRPTSRSSD